jgi:outer membrane protein OmpA-like peptidoglycan-associated protein/opacity protein-like surface antigen
VKIKTVLVVSLLLLMTVSALALDIKNKNGVRVSGPFFIPFDDVYGPEPYMMGWKGQIELKYGITRSFAINLAGGYGFTYDDTLVTEDANTSLTSDEQARTHLNGMFGEITGQYYFLPEQYVQPYFMAGIGGNFWRMKLREDYTDATGNFHLEGTKYNFADFNMKFGLGINFWVSEDFSIDLQYKMSYDLTNLSTDSDNTVYGDLSDFDSRVFRGYIEPSVGFNFFFGGLPDSDDDGVVDPDDECPNTPFGAIVDETGCPLDGDGDGVYDGIDQCANTPAGAVVDITGCPQDTDGDGVYDGIDKCPATPEGATVDENGCMPDGDGDGVPDWRDKQPNTPKGAIVDEDGVGVDTDGDTVYDGIDKCPGTPEGATVDSLGCPLDGDKDGVYDGLDRCPTTPEGVKVNEEGCPVDVKAPVKKITLNIKYATGSFEPDANAKQVLDGLAETMANYTGTKLKIYGFTDNVGADGFNFELSEKRANGVMQYLIYKGVDRDRLSSKGFGENPNFFIGDNATAEGRAKNRRVEIISEEVK